MPELVANKNIKYDGLQQADNDKHKHCRDIKHADRRYEPLNGNDDRIGDPHHECQKGSPRKDEPRSEKSDKNKQHQNAQQPVKDKAEEHFRITSNHARGQPIDHKERIPNDLGKEIGHDKTDKDRDQRSEASIDASSRCQANGAINKCASCSKDR